MLYQVSTQKHLEKKHILQALIFDQNAWLIFLINCLASIAIGYITREYLLTTDVYYNTFGDQISSSRIDEILSFQQKSLWISALLTPVAIGIHLLLVTVCLSVGSLINEWQIKFSSLLSLTTKASIIYVFGRILLTIWLLYTSVDAVNDYYFNNVFSILSLFSSDDIPQWLLYPLSYLNLFEFGFILLIAAGIHLVHTKSWTNSLLFVLATYGLGLLLFCLCIIFLTFNL